MRYLGYAAILGGVLRIANAFVWRLLGVHGAQIAFALTDMALILGFFGFALALRGRIGWLGHCGIALGIGGLLFVRIAAATGIGSYQAAAAVSLFGAAFLGADMLMKHAGSRLAAAMWLAALAVGVVSLALPQAAIAAAILFGAGFISEGSQAPWAR